MEVLLAYEASAYELVPTIALPCGDCRLDRLQPGFPRYALRPGGVAQHGRLSDKKTVDRSTGRYTGRDGKSRSESASVPGGDA